MNSLFTHIFWKQRKCKISGDCKWFVVTRFYYNLFFTSPILYLYPISSHIWENNLTFATKSCRL